MAAATSHSRSHLHRRRGGSRVPDLLNHPTAGTIGSTALSSTAPPPPTAGAAALGASIAVRTRRTIVIGKVVRIAPAGSVCEMPGRNRQHGTPDESAEHPQTDSPHACLGVSRMSPSGGEMSACLSSPSRLSASNLPSGTTV